MHKKESNYLPQFFNYVKYTISVIKLLHHITILRNLQNLYFKVARKNIFNAFYYLTMHVRNFFCSQN